MNHSFRSATAVVISATFMALAPALTSAPAPELRWLPGNTQLVVGFEWNSDVDPSAFDAFQELILSLLFPGGDPQQATPFAGLKFEPRLERLVFAEIPLGGGKKGIVGIASGRGVRIPSTWLADRSSSISELGKDRVIFGDSAAVKICAALDSAAPDRTLIHNATLAARIEEFRSSGQAWGVVTRPWLGLENPVLSSRKAGV